MNDLSNVRLVERPAKASHHVSDSAFVLHTWPWKETSAIAEVFSLSHGRIGVVAKGAKRPKSAIRGVLQLFQPLTLQWFGRTEMKTLKSAEHQRFFPQLSGAALVSAFYLNELVLKLTHREVTHEGLYEAYAKAIEDLSGLGAAQRSDIAAVLRRFEVRLMRELGYGLRLEEEALSHRPIEANARYAYLPERGPVLLDAAPDSGGDAIELSGATLIDMADDDYRNPATLAESRALMRYLLGRLLGDKVIYSRLLMREMK
jgi:DNA repair protein RecO (recombination protein O)